MTLAIEQARAAMAQDEVPVGAVVVRNGIVLAACHNTRERTSKPLAHAEMLALEKAACALGDWRFQDCEIYVTLEPCPMCAGALLMARMGKIVFGAYDSSQGCCGSVYLLPMDKALNGQSTVIGGIMEEECRGLLTAFFENKRQGV